MGDLGKAAQLRQQISQNIFFQGNIGVQQGKAPVPMENPLIGRSKAKSDKDSREFSDFSFFVDNIV